MKPLILVAGIGFLFAFFRSGGGAQNPLQRTNSAEPRTATAVFITFGELQERETDYSGTLSTSDGRIVDLIPWRFFGADRIAGQNSWTMRTNSANFEDQPDKPRPVVVQGPGRNIVPKGITATIEASPAAEIRIQTRRSNYSFHLEDLRAGRVLRFEDGDVSVQAVPAPNRVSPPSREGVMAEHDYPSLAVASGGAAWIAWQTYEGGGDRLFAAHSTPSGWSSPEPLTPSGQDLYRTAIAEDARGRIWVVWSQRAGELWDLMARTNDGQGGWTAPRKLTNAGEPNFFHKLVRDRSGNLHLIWVAYQNGQSHVMWSKLVGGRWSTPTEISGASAWMPDAAADSAGNLYIAWDSYRTGNYDIFLRRIAADGTMGAIQQVTKSPLFEAHASLAVDGQDRVWLAWDESGANWGKDYARDATWRGTTLYSDRRPRVAVLENGRWMTPAADPMAAMPQRYNRYVETPKLACDRAGRIWMELQARTSTAINRTDFWANNGRWNTFLTAYEGDRWRPAAQIPNSSTRPDGAFQLLPSAAGVWAVWTNDNRLFPAAGAEANERRNEIEFARVDDSLAPSEPSLRAFTEQPAIVAPVHPHEAADIQRERTYRIRTPQGELRILRGDFHRHTEISPDGAGDGSLEDYFRYMMDAAGMDTGIVSDHNAGAQEYTWWRTEKAIDLFHVAGAYTPLFGYERSVPYPNGHRNVVFARRGVHVLPISRDEIQGKVNSGPILYPYLRENRGVCMLHSLATDQGSDYRDNDPEVEPLVEIYQGYHANYEYAGAPRAESPGYHVSTHGPYRPLGFYWNALAKNYKLGVESSSDHISTHSSYTMIYTPSPERRDIVESMRKRHAYGATDNIVLDVRARDRQGREWMMGDSFAAPAAPVLHVNVLGTAPIQIIEIVKNGKFIYQTQPNAETAEFDFSDTATSPGQSWYYVRVIQEDRNLAWSSPIWVNYSGH